MTDTEYSAGRVHYCTTTVTYLHATAERYSPAPEGGSYVDTFQCTHNHPDTKAGYAAVQECGQKLKRILATGRVPNWATS